MDKFKIKEVIVVEGKNDISAVKAAVEAEVIQVNGHSIKKSGNLSKLEKAYNTNGLIILTDPDFAGDSIRKYINKYFPKAKNAYISRKSATKNGDVGIENATKEDILSALKKYKTNKCSNENKFDSNFMLEYKLSGYKNSKFLRQELGDKLGVGYSNSKQFLSKLNKYGISMDEFLDAYKNIVKED